MPTMLYLNNSHMHTVKAIGQELLNCHIHPRHRPAWISPEEMPDGGVNLTFYANDGSERRTEWVTVAELTRRLVAAARARVANCSYSVRTAEDAFARYTGGGTALAELTDAALARRDANRALERALAEYEAIRDVQNAVTAFEKETT